jgi:hypothetical protein
MSIFKAISDRANIIRSSFIVNHLIKQAGYVILSLYSNKYMQYFLLCQGNNRINSFGYK